MCLVWMCIKVLVPMILSSIFKHFLNQISPSTIKTVQSFLDTEFLLKSLNHIFVTFIPKMDASTKVEHFCPISLCNVCYKVISWLLANRITIVLEFILFPSQSAFILGRYIQDNSTICHGVMHHMNKKKVGKLSFMTLKIDMSKTHIG